MRIAHLVTGGEFWRPMRRRLEDEAARSDGTSVVHYDLHYPPLSGGSALTLALSDLLHVEAGLRAADDGRDAIFVNAVPSYGVALLRASVAVPVVAGGEAAMLAARTLGGRFSIVTVWPRSFSSTLYGRLLSETGMEEHCASVVYASTEDEVADGVYTDLGTAAPGLLDRLERACRRAIDQDGARAIVLGCTCMHLLAGELVARLDRPVLDPMIVGWRAAALAAELSPPGHRPGVAAPREHRQAMLDLLAGARASAGDAGCEVCETAEDAVVTA
jgi:allantoin racemase